MLKAVDIMKTVEHDRSSPKPKILIVGEYLLNFHPGANHDIEDYPEKNGFAIIEAHMREIHEKRQVFPDGNEYILSRYDFAGG